MTLGKLLKSKGLEGSWVRDQLRRRGLKYSKSMFYLICQGKSTPKKKGFSSKFASIVNCEEGLVNKILTENKKSRDEARKD